MLFAPADSTIVDPRGVVKPIDHRSALLVLHHLQDQTTIELALHHLLVEAALRLTRRTTQSEEEPMSVYEVDHLGVVLVALSLQEEKKMEISVVVDSEPLLVTFTTILDLLHRVVARGHLTYATDLQCVKEGQSQLHTRLIDNVHPRGPVGIQITEMGTIDVTIHK